MIVLAALWGCPSAPEPVPPQPSAACTDTWEGFARAFFASWCTSCHHSALPPDQRGGAPPSIDLDTYAGALAAAPTLAASTTTDPPRMPPGGGTSARERERLAEWLACGLPADAATPTGGCAGVVPGPLTVATDTDRDALCASGSGVDGDLHLSIGGALPCLCTVSGALIVEAAAPRLQLPTLIEIDGALIVEHSPALLALDAGALERTGALHLADNPQLQDLGLGDLSGIGGDLIVSSGGLAGPLELDEVRSIAGSLELTDLPGLSRLGLARLEALGGDLRLQGVGLSQLSAGPLAQVPGTLQICDTDALSSLAGLDRIEAIDGDLIVCDNEALSELGLRSLRWVGGDLMIEGNPALPAAQIAALLSVAQIAGSITITDNQPAP